MDEGARSLYSSLQLSLHDRSGPEDLSRIRRSRKRDRTVISNRRHGVVRLIQAKCSTTAMGRPSQCPELAERIEQQIFGSRSLTERSSPFPFLMILVVLF
jgi:hypothetical protein